MDAENVEAILEQHYIDAANAFDAADDDDRPWAERLEGFVKGLQFAAYEFGFELGAEEDDVEKTSSDDDAIVATLDQEAGWNLARNLLYGAPVTIKITR